MWNVFHSSGWMVLSLSSEWNFYIIYSPKAEMTFLESEKGEKKLLIEKNKKKDVFIKKK